MAAIYASSNSTTEDQDLDIEHQLTQDNDLESLTIAGGSSGESLGVVSGTAVEENTVYSGQSITPDYEVDTFDHSEALSLALGTAVESSQVDSNTSGDYKNWGKLVRGSNIFILGPILWGQNADAYVFMVPENGNYTSYVIPQSTISSALNPLSYTGPYVLNVDESGVQFQAGFGSVATFAFEEDDAALVNVLNYSSEYGTDDNRFQCRSGRLRVAGFSSNRSL